MILRLAGWALALGLALGSPAHAQGGTYLADLSKAYPAAYALWQQTLPYAIGALPEWIAKLSGVTTPIRDVTVHGVPMKFGTTCLPHDCGGNQAGILFTPRQDRIVGLVELSSRKDLNQTIMIIGPMSNEEYACVRRLLANNDLAVC